MFPQMAFVLAATAALWPVALSPTPRRLGHGHWGGGPGWGGHGWGWGGLASASRLASWAAQSWQTCLQRRIIDTPYGPAVRWVNVCY